MKAYISGPITGHPLEDRRKAFAEAAVTVADELQCEVVNPMEVVPGCEYMCDPGQLSDAPPFIHTWQCWMKHDIKAMMDCDTIVMLPDWGNSKGAVLEYLIAESLGFKLLHMDSQGYMANE